MRRVMQVAVLPLLLLCSAATDVHGVNRMAESDDLSRHPDPGIGARQQIGEPRTLVVNHDGTGDARTIQEGIDLANRRRDEGGADTLLVMPGFYDETITIEDQESHWLTLVCPGGPLTSRVRRVLCPAGDYRSIGWGWTISGLGVVEPVAAHADRVEMLWLNCRFESGYSSHSRCSYGNMIGCEFNGPTELIGYFGRGFDDLVFRDAPLRFISSEDGAATLRNCRFEGRVDTALFITPRGNVFSRVSNCTFSGPRFGIVAEPKQYGFMEGVRIDSCRFEVTEAAVSFDFDIPTPGSPMTYWGLELSVIDTDFIGGATAIRWNSRGTKFVHVSRVTVLGPRGDGIFARMGGSSTINNVVVRNAGGRGIVLEPVAENVWATVSGCLVENSGGAGLVVSDPGGLFGKLVVEANVVAGSGDVGIRVRSNAPFRGGSAAGSVARNTAVLNANDGIDLTLADSRVLSVHHNLAAGNDGAGLRTHGLAADSVRHNDSWSNAAGNYAGDPVSTDNLSADPGLCDALAGDWHVQTGSPCAPSGPYGQIGVLGVGCDASRVEAEIEGAHPVNTGSNAKLRLAVFGHRLFDPASMDPATVLLAGVQAESRAVTDANGDGFEDLILAFRARGMTAAGSLRDSIFSAELDGGTRVYGRVAMRRVPAPRADAGVQLQEERFAIDVVRSAVLGRTVRASITTRAGSPAALDLYDVAGRRVAGQSLSSRGGMQVVELVPAGGLRNGIYFLRLAQMQEQLIEKVVILR